MAIYGESFVDGHRYPRLGEVCRSSRPIESEDNHPTSHIHGILYFHADLRGQVDDYKIDDGSKLNHRIIYNQLRGNNYLGSEYVHMRVARC